LYSKANFVPTFDASSGFPRSVCTVKVRTVEKTGTIGTNDTCKFWMKPALLRTRRSFCRTISLRDKVLWKLRFAEIAWKEKCCKRASSV